MVLKFPSEYQSRMELNDLYGIDLPSDFQILPSYEVRSKLSKILLLDNFDLDENYVQSVNSKYYELPEFSKIPSHNKNFSLFHVNTHSLSKNFGQFQNVSSISKISFDVIGVFEIKQTIDKDFIVNVNTDAYNMYTQPSKSSSGGAAIYVKKKLHHLKRADLCILNDDFESI